ncbi:MAG: EAL domain-containing protein [Rhodospirillaceae bacterium]|nr:EAL domain-containing protein [Rhodospirillaceae bacterium]
MNTQGARGYQEGLLVDTLDRMRRNPEGRKVVHLRLSQLMPHNRTPVKVRIINRMFRNLESGRQAQIFLIGNDDMVMIVNAAAQRDMANICERIRTLFESDPITHTPAGEPDRFILWFDLNLDAALAIHTAQQLKQLVQKMPPRSETALPGLTPASLDDVQKKLAFANVVPFIRDQVAVRINAQTNAAAIEFYEFFMSVMDVQKAIAPGTNLLGDRWLFQELSRTMDQRMLEMVVRAPHARGVPAISLNLNLETVVTPTFLSFLERIEKEQRVIVEVQAMDVLNNLPLYTEVESALSQMKHAVLIDGLTTTALSVFDVSRLKPDYAKLVWAPELLNVMDSKGSRSTSMIKQMGGDKIVLSRVDTADALQWGLRNGIELFQGRFLDSFGKPGRAKPARPKGAA